MIGIKDRDNIALLWATFADAEEAERIAETVLNEQLAVCVNVLAPCASIYRWKGKIERGSEVPALFKTSCANAERLHRRIEALHNYDLPVIETWHARASAAVFDWLQIETGA